VQEFPPSCSDAVVGGERHVGIWRVSDPLVPLAITGAHNLPTVTDISGRLR
jgi:hypothetical protein